LGEFDFFANFPARRIPAAVHLLAILRLAVDTTAASYLVTTCNAAEISRIQVTYLVPRLSGEYYGFCSIIWAKVINERDIIMRLNQSDYEKSAWNAIC